MLSGAESFLTSDSGSGIVSDITSAYTSNGISGVINYVTDLVGDIDASTALNTAGTLVSYSNPLIGGLIKAGANLVDGDYSISDLISTVTDYDSTGVVATLQNVYSAGTEFIDSLKENYENTGISGLVETVTTAVSEYTSRLDVGDAISTVGNIVSYVNEEAGSMIKTGAAIYDKVESLVSAA